MRLSPAVLLNRLVLCFATASFLIGGEPAPALAPEISLSLRGVAQRTIEQGEPLFVAVLVEAPTDSAADLRLAPSIGSWSDAMVVELLEDKEGTAVARATRVVAPTDAAVTLSAASPATSAVWSFPSSVTQGLAPGAFSIRARLAIQDGSGWKGEARSEELRCELAAPSTQPARIVQRTLNLAREAAIAGRAQEAQRLVDTLLREWPDSVPLLMARAELATEAGDHRGALVYVDRAWAIAQPNPTQHPLSALFELEQRIARASMPSASP